MIETEFAERLTTVEERSKTNTHRIDELAGHVDAVNRLAIAVEVMASEQKHQTAAMGELKHDVTNLGAKVESLEQKPAKRWDNLVEKVIWAVVAAVVAFFLGRVGL